ncbi:MAG: hypothetical protein WC635_14615 [Bacteriovorax sp.]|jgi:hypothetical protein
MKKIMLADTGLNLFQSIEVSKLPKEILEIFYKQNIPFESNDTLYLFASGGRDLWNRLTHPLNESEHPIDHFSISQIKKMDPKARILFPHEEWNVPLQRLGRLLNISRPSPLGMDISNEYGLWFAFRGVFLSKQKFKTEKYKLFKSPCESCADKPCISACPGSALNPAGDFKIAKCADYRLSRDSKCAQTCLSRMICPYKAEHQYSEEQIHYHMTRIALLKHLANYVSSC